MKLLKLAATAATLLLIGAGCATEAPEPTEPNDTTPTPTTTATDANTFSATAESNEPGTLLVTWKKPADAKSGNTFRVLHSAKEEPELPTAYWYERSSGDAVEAEISNVSVGTRFVRVCEYNGTECVRYSNTVQVEVK